MAPPAQSDTGARAAAARDGDRKRCSAVVAIVAGVIVLLVLIVVVLSRIGSSPRGERPPAVPRDERAH